MKRLITLNALAAVALFALPSAQAIQLLDKDDAVKQVLGTTDAEEVEKSISFDQADAIAAQLKKEIGRMVPTGYDLRVRPSATYFIPKGGENENVAVILQEPGKWGPIEFIVGLDAKTAQIKDLAVMSYTEKRGRPIARNNFLRQFKGNKVDDAVIIGRGVRGISGATVSSWAAAVVVRKAQLHYKHAVLDAQ